VAPRERGPPRGQAGEATTELLRIVAPDILNSFGGDGGREEFRQTWGLAQPDRSQLWVALGFVLALGGRLHGDTAFYAPYTFEGTPGDGFEALAVLGRNVVVRAQPDSSSAVIDTLSFEAVTKWRDGHAGRAAPRGWEPLRTSDGKAGWSLGRIFGVRLTTGQGSCGGVGSGGCGLSLPATRT
jgi:hypothetical protein